MNQVTPGGILSVKYKWPETSKSYDHNTFLTINREPSEVSYYFWAQQFWFRNGDGGYFGLQTGGELNGQETKIAIFSIWKALDAKKSGLANSWSGDFGHEGSGFSCKISFEWKENRQYRLRLSKDSVLAKSDSSNWWSAYIQDVNAIEEECIGQISLPTEWGELKADDNFFVEYFLPVKGCENLPYAKATLHRPNRENGEVVPISLPLIETYGNCASNGIAVMDEASTAVILEIGLIRRQ